ncbi:MAG: ATP synthase F0 subunit B [Candidatus Aminicenantes bacterium]|nr:ATP synthase F0 subunit B [Candidatus Aminicenantes bacterium]NTV81396.1 ATP synthase F0 subunit B [Candidatus Aminicenantes bacterium]
MLSINATAIVVFAVVWILVLVLTRIFFKPVLRVLDERAARIARDKAAASGSRESYESDLRRIEEGLKEARAAADAIRSEAEAEALKEKSRLVREVQAEGRAEVEKAKEELLREMDILRKELETRTAEIAATIEKKVLGE